MEEEPLYQYDYPGDGYANLDYADFTLDYKNIPYLGEIKKLPLYEIILKSFLYATIIFFSLVGNSLIIVVVLKHKQMRTTTNFYIVNLAVADILVTVFCTWVHLVNNLNNNNWVLGRFFCKFNTFSQVFCLIASVLSLTLIAYDRFFGIVFALKAHMTRRKARFSIGVIWICSFMIASPLLWYRELNERQWLDYTERWCDDIWPVETTLDLGTNTTVSYMPSRTIYFTFVSAVLYFFPIIAMAIAYSVIIRKLNTSSVPGERIDSGLAAQKKTKRKVIMMLATIMTVFGVCWLPYQIVLLYSELRETRNMLEEWFFTMQFLAGCFAYSNSALNPVIYAMFNRNFKNALLDLKDDVAGNYMGPRRCSTARQFGRYYQHPSMRRMSLQYSPKTSYSPVSSKSSPLVENRNSRSKRAMSLQPSVAALEKIIHYRNMVSEEKDFANKTYSPTKEILAKKSTNIIFQTVREE